MLQFYYWTSVKWEKVAPSRRRFQLTFTCGSNQSRRVVSSVRCIPWNSVQMTERTAHLSSNSSESAETRARFISPSLLGRARPIEDEHLVRDVPVSPLRLLVLLAYIHTQRCTSLFLISFLINAAALRRYIFDLRVSRSACSTRCQATQTEFDYLNSLGSCCPASRI